MKRIIYILLMLSLLPLTIFSQSYEATPCNCCGNSELKNLLKGGKLAKIYVHDCGIGGGHTLSSSFLKPGGVAPKDITKEPNYKPSSDPDEAMGLAEKFAIDYDSWSCTYAASMLKDGDTKTAWVEGVNGQGMGEVIIVPHVRADKKIEIYSGFGKSEALYKANSRPKSIKVHIVRADPALGGAAQCGAWYENITVLKSQIITLQDVNKFQPLSTPVFKRETYNHDGTNYEYVYWLMIEIVDVYPGLKYQDTCISEIKNVE